MILSNENSLVERHRFELEQRHGGRVQVQPVVQVRM